MKFIKPKNKNAESVEWKLSEQTRTIVKYFAEYTEYTGDEVVEAFLLNVLKDEDFIDWIKNKRKCNPDPVHPTRGITLDCHTRTFSNWSVAEEISRLVQLETV